MKPKIQIHLAILTAGILAAIAIYGITSEWVSSGHVPLGILLYILYVATHFFYIVALLRKNLVNAKNWFIFWCVLVLISVLPYSLYILSHTFLSLPPLVLLAFLGYAIAAVFMWLGVRGLARLIELENEQGH